MEKKTVNKKLRKYDDNFNLEFLKMTKTQSAAEVVLNIGIGENLLYNLPKDEKAKVTFAESEIYIEF